MGVLDGLQRRILLVEDEARIAETLVYALTTDGFDVTWAKLGSEALTKLADETFALVLLDVGLPDCNGFDVCRQLRRTSNIPLIFLTARSDEIDRIVGLEMGADDYIPKPFSPREVCARVRSVLRRSGSNPPKTTGSRFSVDSEGHRIRYQGTWLTLTRYEFGLLAKLLTRPEQIFTRAQLMDAVWGDADTFDRTVDTHIKTLRAKLRAVDAQGDDIVTHRGVGYSVRGNA